MSTANQLTTRSSGQEQLKEEWNNLKAEKVKAKNALRQAKREIPQDPEKVNNAKAEVAKAESALKAQRIKEKEFNNAEKARVLGAGQTKQDTLDNPTKPDASQAENAAKTAESSMPEDKAQSTESSTSDDDKDATQSSKSSSKNNEQKNQQSKKGLQLGQSFYDSVANVIKGNKTGNALDSASKTAKEQAQNYRNRSAMNQMEAQRAQQIANQNPYSEAGKIASVQNDAENRQTINNTSFTAGTAAARLRKTNAPDVQSQIAREDQQQTVANQRRDEANTAQEENTAAEGDSETFAFKSRDLNDDRAESTNLSMGTPDYSERTDTVTEDTETDNTETEDAEPQDQPMPSGEPQHVINALLGSSKGEDLRNGSATRDKELYEWALSQGVTPIQAGQHKNEKDVNSWESEFIANNGEAGQNVIQQLRQGRVGAGNDASRNFSANEMDQMNKSMTIDDISSDARIKNITACLSDLRLKSIREAYDRDGYCSPEDFMWLAAHTGGKFNHNDRDYDFFNDDDWSDDSDGSVLSGYADYIKNYVYTYKPEATDIDPRIDPNQEHIGPMAQDIEMVNPACIKETPEGVKTVDTARLAMMNAGAIGDLARQMQELVDKLKAIGVE